MPDSRTALPALARSRGISLRALSIRIGRNEAYLQQHIIRGTPRRLDWEDSYVLARLLGVDQRELGARDAWRAGADYFCEYAK